MLGSLSQYMSVDGMKQYLEVDVPQALETDNKLQPNINQTSHRKGKSSAISNYTVQDKRQLLNRFAKNHRELTTKQIERSMDDIIQNKSLDSQSLKKSPYEHTSFFVKPEILKDYIAKQNLKRKHNLLRAIIRTKQVDNKSRGTSDYDESFNRLCAAYSNIEVEPNLKITKPSMDSSFDPFRKITSKHLPQQKSLSKCKQILQYQKCLSWAKKHKKDGSFYENMLFKDKRKQQKIDQQQNRRKAMEQISSRIKIISS